MSVIDLDAYFARIAYRGDRAATLDVLRQLHARHAEAIPYENLDPLLGRPVRLDPASLQAKLLHSNRGGYCFEQNLLLRHALEALGFRVTGLAARVLWNAVEGVVPPRGHMILRIDLPEGPYIADVGFGGQSLTGPVRLEADTEQETPHEPFRLVAAGGELVMQSKIRGEWRSLYYFDQQPQQPVDYEVINWYLSNHPESPFVTGLRVARTEPGRRYTLRGNELAVHELQGASERRALTTGEEIRAALEGPFRLTLPEAPGLAAALARVAAGA